MKRRFPILLGWIVTAAVLGILDWQYDLDYVQKGFQTAATIALMYFVFKFLFEGGIIKQITDAKTKYVVRKAGSILFLVGSTVIVLQVWVENRQNLMVVYGLIAAGMTLALQDIIKNFAGSMIIFITGMYRVGDRIQVQEQHGDVLDIGIMYTTVMELREWVDGDQATGRLCTIPNNKVFSSNVLNYTKDHSFMWDEIVIPLTYGSDWQRAQKLLITIVQKETNEAMQVAEREIEHIGEQYFLSKRTVEPAVFVTLTDNWIQCSVRYVTKVKERRSMHTLLTQKILALLEKEKNIKVASETLSIVDLPAVKIKRR